MKVAFLYPNTDQKDALCDWVQTLRRHVKGHEVCRALSTAGCAGADVVLALTQREKYPQPRIDADLLDLRHMKIPYGVVHNQDNPAVPAPGDHPSYVWTFRSYQKLAQHRPHLVRMPVLPAAVKPTADLPTHVATFGNCEPKKAVVQMAKWCKDRGVVFSVFCPGAWAEANADYVDRVRKTGARVCLHPWAPCVEDLAYLFADVSHFLFVLPPGKGGDGGSPTSCRYATAFGRPVVVIDDENTYALDGFTVRESLDALTPDDLKAAELPNGDWVPEKYVDRLVRLTLEHWGKA